MSSALQSDGESTAWVLWTNYSVGTFVAWDQAFLGLFRLHEFPNLRTCVFFSRVDSQLSPDCKEFDPIYEILPYIPGIWINAKGRNDWGES